MKFISVFSGYMYPSMKTMDTHTSTKHIATLELELVIFGAILGKCSPKECMGEFGSHGLHAGLSVFVLESNLRPVIVIPNLPKL